MIALVSFASLNLFCFSFFNILYTATTIYHLVTHPAFCSQYTLFFTDLYLAFCVAFLIGFFSWPHFFLIDQSNWRFIVTNHLRNILHVKLKAYSAFFSFRFPTKFQYNLCSFTKRDKQEEFLCQVSDFIEERTEFIYSQFSEIRRLKILFCLRRHESSWLRNHFGVCMQIPYLFLNVCKKNNANDVVHIYEFSCCSG